MGPALPSRHTHKNVPRPAPPPTPTPNHELETLNREFRVDGFRFYVGLEYKEAQGSGGSANTGIESAVSDSQKLGVAPDVSAQAEDVSCQRSNPCVFKSSTHPEWL